MSFSSSNSNNRNNHGRNNLQPQPPQQPTDPPTPRPAKVARTASPPFTISAFVDKLVAVAEMSLHPPPDIPDMDDLNNSLPHTGTDDDPQPAAAGNSQPPHTDLEAESATILASIFQSIDGTLPHDHKVYNAIKQYIHFCDTYQSKFPILGTQPVHTELGSFSGHPLSVLGFIGFCRTGGRLYNPANFKLTSKSAVNLYYALRKGMLAITIFDPTVLPTWIKEPLGKESLVRKTFNTWALEDPRRPAQLQGFLTPTHIFQWALFILGGFLSGEDPSETMILYALLLRIQSGTNTRHTDLVASTLWKDVGVYSDGTPWINITNTKPFRTRGPKAASQTKPTSTMLLTDILTKALFFWWYSWYSPANRPDTSDEDYFFPRVNKKGFNFQAPLTTDNHSEACRHCAIHTQECARPEFLRTFTSQSVRRGVGAQTYERLRDFLRQNNPTTGRTGYSKMDLYYCPTEVILKPSPLFTDEADIHAQFHLYLADTLAKYKSSALCRACGFPNCRCTQCLGMMENNNPKVKHRCWISQIKARRPSVRGYTMPDHICQEFASAWESLGVCGLPEWHRTAEHKAMKSMGGYHWPDTSPTEFAVWPGTPPDQPERPPIFSLTQRE
jgi:hypothetical protein